MSTLPPEERRRVIFTAIVAAQDEGLSVEASRTLIAGRYDIDTDVVRKIENEGLDQGWLSEE